MRSVSSKFKTLGKTGVKPAVAFSNHAQAVARIRAKYEALTMAVQEIRSAEVARDAGERSWAASLLESLPTSQRQFNAWSSEQLAAYPALETESFSSNAQVTLKGSGLIDSVDQVLAHVRALQQVKPPEAVREDTIASLRRRLAVANRLREIAETQVIELKSAVLDARSAEDKEAAKVVSAKKMAGDTIAKLRRRVGELEERLRQRGGVGDVVKLGRVPRKS
jgi:hypothetical protein